jgi:lipopolysaccharide transport system permease protein
MTSERGERWAVNEASTSRWAGFGLREAWRNRELGFFLAQRTVKLRYRQTFFGVAWAVLQPLVALAIFSVVFGRYAKLPSDGMSYSVFVYPALCVWTYVSTSITGAALELVGHQELVTKVYFPRMLAPMSALVPGLLDLAVSLVLAGVLIAISGVSPGPALLLLPVWIAAAVLTALGVGLGLAALNVRFRDVRHTLPFLLQTLFFLSPIVYSSSIIEDDSLRWLYSLNPLVLVIDGMRWSLVDAPAPPASDLLSAVTIVLVTVCGLTYFRAAEQRFADVI